MDMQKMAEEIDKLLRDKGIYAVKKSEIVAKYRLINSNRSIMWNLLEKKGWINSYSFLSRPTSPIPIKNQN